MSFISASFSSDPYRKIWRPEEKGGLFKQLCNASSFVRGLGLRLRFGELSRAPLFMLRLQVVAEIAECDWMARSPDPWDVDLPGSLRHRHASLQALRDAIDIRGLLFETLPQVERANFRVFRQSQECSPEMIIAGSVHRNDQSSRDVHSIVMRAKVLGFRFRMEGDVLRKI